MTNVLLGASSWQAPQWTQTYYPEDLPEEWRLAYYANEFSTTLIDCGQYLAGESLDHLADILEDCQYGFRPVLSVAMDRVEPEQVEGFVEFLEVLDPDIGQRRLAGVSLRGLDRMNGRNMLSSFRAVIPDQLPIALDYGPTAQDISQLALDSGISPVWESAHEAGGYHGCWLGYIDLTGQPRQIANHVQAFLNSASEGQDTLCIIARKGYDDIEQLFNLSSMVRLING